MFHLHHWFTAVILAVTLDAVSGFWILTQGQLVTERLDPIVSPGKVSSHVHTFVGSNGVSSQPESSYSGSCTTAGVTADMSNYWAPQLYSYKGGKFDSVPLSFVNTYYLNRPGATSEIKAFPKGLKMLAGNAMATSQNPDPQLASAISFMCLDYTNGSEQYGLMPNRSCPQGLRLQVTFPSCWDGVNLDSADHKSHMSYPIGPHPDNGNCPSTHPIKTMTLFYEFVYDTSKIDNTGGSSLILANGDMVGYTLHADFLSGWDTNVLQAAVDQCTSDLYNNLEACPPFKPYIDRSGASSCTTSPKVDEQVLGSLNYLPGCNAPLNGPLKGLPANPSCSGSSTTSTSSTTTSTTKSSGPTSTTSSTSKPTQTNPSKIVTVTVTVTSTVTFTPSPTPANISNKKKIKRIPVRRSA
ncbi:hypothetical protein IE53DRAFT_388208 [Violaceomyces palustris]|uniref:Uncharacterized protein n=1 Tax=Violaceomyces palustris TaxID=1673888 RepID=A0ACD0NUQ3_9BASI|nr:hypothetical protein IE53DRAFT_388208 [Violaceomyces palustris]